MVVQAVVPPLWRPPRVYPYQADSLCLPGQTQEPLCPALIVLLLLLAEMTSAMIVMSPVVVL